MSEESQTPQELMKRIAAMRTQLGQFRIIGGEGVTVHGSMQHGYAVSVEGGGTGGGGGASGGNGGDATGACCIDGACSIQTETDCTGAGGTYQGDDSPCEEDTCAGICCIPLETTGGPTACSLAPKTEEECAEIPGSVFFNDGTICEDCPTCPTVVLAADSVTLTHNKCGFTLIGSGDQYYQSSIDCGYTFADPTLPAVWLHIDEPCCDAEDAGCDVSHSGGGDCENWNPDTCEHAGYCNEMGDCCDCVTACNHELDPECEDFHVPDCQTDFHLSDEYLTSDLIDRTYGDLVPYSEAYACASGDDCICHGGSCGPTFSGCLNAGGTYVSYGCFIVAQRDLAPDERSFGITRFQYKFQFYDYPTDDPYTGCPFRLDWELIFVPEGGSEEDAVITPMTQTFSGGTTESSVYELLEPDIDGTNTLSNVVCTPLPC